MEGPCKFGIVPPGSISHEVSCKLIILLSLANSFSFLSVLWLFRKKIEKCEQFNKCYIQSIEPHFGLIWTRRYELYSFITELQKAMTTWSNKRHNHITLSFAVHFTGWSAVSKLTNLRYDNGAKIAAGTYIEGVVRCSKYWPIYRLAQIPPDWSLKIMSLKNGTLNRFTIWFLNFLSY